MNYLKGSVTGLCLTLLLSSCSQDKSSSVGSGDGGMVTDSTRIAFISQASNLIDGVNPQSQYNQIYLKNIITGEVQLVSSNKNGEAATYGAYFVSQSADANKIAFFSSSANLIEGASSNNPQVFLKNMKTGEVELVSKNEAGEMGDGQDYFWFLKISADGNRIGFMTNAKNFGPNTAGDYVIFVKDMSSGKIIRLDVTKEGVEGDGGSNSSANPTYSIDGKKIAFESTSKNLFPNDLNNAGDVFVKDFDTEELTLISAAANGTPGDGFSGDSVISPDGTKVVFVSNSTNLVPEVNDGKNYLYIKEIATGKIERVFDKEIKGGMPSFSLDGKKLAFTSKNSTLVPNDINDSSDIFVIDIASGEINLVTAKVDGSQLPTRDAPNVAPTFTPDGKNIYFQSQLSFDGDDSDSDNSWNDWDVYLKNLSSGELSLIGRNSSGVKANMETVIDSNW